MQMMAWEVGPEIQPFYEAPSDAGPETHTECLDHGRQQGPPSKSQVAGGRDWPVGSAQVSEGPAGAPPQ